MKPKLSIIIVNWNTEKLLKQCLESIFNSQQPTTNNPRLTIEIIVIDNGSTDGSVNYLRSIQSTTGISPQGQGYGGRASTTNNHRPIVRVIENKNNLGFSKANNQGLKLAQGDYIMLLNSDTIVKPGALAKLVTFLNDHPGTVISPRLLLPNGKPQHDYYMKFPNVAQLLIYHHRLFRPLFLKFNKLRQLIVDSPQSTQPFKLSQVTGASMVTSRIVWDKVGLLDEDYQFFYEDVDWCWRAKKLGIEFWVIPDAAIIHYGGYSWKKKTQENKQDAYRQFFSSLLLFTRKNYPPRLQHLIHRSVLANFIITLKPQLFYDFAFGKTEQTFFRDTTRVSNHSELSLLNRRIFQPAVLASLLTGLSSLISFGFQILIAFYFGAGLILDAYFAALALPLVVSGIMASAFIAVLVPYLTKEGKEGHDHEIIGGLIPLVGLATGILVLVGWIWPDFFLSLSINHISQTLFQARAYWYWLWPMVLINSFVALFGAISVYYRKYLLTPISIVISNISQILFFIILYKLHPTISPAISLFFSAVVQLIVLLIGLNHRITVRLNLNFQTHHIKKIIIRLWPLLLGGLIYRSTNVVDRYFVSGLGEGKITFINYGYKMVSTLAYILIYGIQTIGLVKLSESALLTDKSKFFKRLTQNLKWTYLIILPVSVIVFIFSKQIISLFLGHGYYSRESVLATGDALRWYAPAMAGMALSGMVATGLYALDKSRQVVVINLIMMGLFIGTTGVLIGPLNYLAPAVAFSLTVWVQYVVYLLVINFSREHAIVNTNEKINLLLVVERCYPLTGGIEVGSVTLANNLTTKNVNMTIVTRRITAGTKRVDSVHHIPLIRFGITGLNRINDYSAAVELLFYIIKHRYDFSLIQVHGGLSNLFGSTGIGIARILGIPVVGRIATPGELDITSLGSIRPNYRPHILVYFRLWLAKKANAYIAQTEEIKNQILAAGISPNKITLIPNGIDTNYFKQKDTMRNEIREHYSIPAKAVLLLYLGRLVKRKGLLELITVFKSISQKYPNVYWLIVGSGKNHPDSIEYELTDYIANNDLSGRVTLVGETHESLTYYQAADIFVYPSLYHEGRSNSVLEAMACGLPLLINNVGGLNEIVVDGKNGFIVSNSQQTEKLLTKLITDSSTRKEMGKSSRQLAVKKYSADIMGDSYLKYYRSLLVDRTIMKLPNI